MWERISEAWHRKTFLLKVLSCLRDRRPFWIGQARWEREYAAGGWDHLADAAEMPRFGVIAAYCRSVGPSASMLDLGCGVGLLDDWLDQDPARRYVGVDIAQTAIRQARAGARANARFEVADISTFDPGERFDVIVLNEVLYYIEFPEQLVSRYATFLNPGGVFVISMYRAVRSLQSWHRCANEMLVLGEVTLSRSRGPEWTIRLCRARGAGGGSMTMRHRLPPIGPLYPPGSKPPIPPKPGG